jgi:hypothetical protein
MRNIVIAVLAGTTFSLGLSLAHPVNAAEKAAAAPTADKWEYRVKSAIVVKGEWRMVSPGGVGIPAVEECNQMGEQGWELVNGNVATIASNGGMSASTSMTLFFKRRIAG